MDGGRSKSAEIIGEICFRRFPRHGLHQGVRPHQLRVADPGVKTIRFMVASSHDDRFPACIAKLRYGQFEKGPAYATAPKLGIGSWHAKLGELGIATRNPQHGGSHQQAVYPGDIEHFAIFGTVAVAEGLDVVGQVRPLADLLRDLDPKLIDLFGQCCVFDRRFKAGDFEIICHLGYSSRRWHSPV